METELKRIQKDFPRAWIGYNAGTGKQEMYIIPISWTNSLLITKI